MSYMNRWLALVMLSSGCSAHAIVPAKLTYTYPPNEAPQLDAASMGAVAFVDAATMELYLPLFRGVRDSSSAHDRPARLVFSPTSKTKKCWEGRPARAPAEARIQPVKAWFVVDVTQVSAAAPALTPVSASTTFPFSVELAAARLLQLAYDGLDDTAVPWFAAPIASQSAAPSASVPVTARDDAPSEADSASAANEIPRSEEPGASDEITPPEHADASDSTATADTRSPSVAAPSVASEPLHLTQPLVTYAFADGDPRDCDQHDVTQTRTPDPNGATCPDPNAMACLPRGTLVFEFPDDAIYGPLRSETFWLVPSVDWDTEVFHIRGLYGKKPSRLPQTVGFDFSRKRAR